MARGHSCPYVSISAPTRRPELISLEGSPAPLQAHQVSWPGSCIQFTHVLEIWKEGLTGRTARSPAVSTTPLVLLLVCLPIPPVLFSLGSRTTNIPAVTKSSAHASICSLSHLLSHHSVFLAKTALLFLRGILENGIFFLLLQEEFKITKYR